MSGMIKPKEYKVEDSNVEGLGGEDHKKLVKDTAVKGEPAWKRWKEYLSGSILDGEEAVKVKGRRHHVEIWRIEKFQVKFWPRSKHGLFFAGDSYILLHTTEQPPKNEGDKTKIEWDLYFWIGQNSTQDEYGTAAYKTVELDTILDDGPVQHREVQDHESQGFHNIFGSILCKPIRIEEGGVDSGFRHVEPKSYKPRLLHLKGRKKVSVKAIDMKFSEMNHGDVFVLDKGLEVIAWTGARAGMFERNKCRELCQSIDSERQGKAKIFNIRGDDSDKEQKEKLDVLEGSPSDIKSAEDGGADDAPQAPAQRKLFRLSDASGSLKFTEESNVAESSLDTNDVFIFDAGYEVFAWVGKSATLNEKNNAIPYATQYLSDYNRPLHTPITRVLEGGENAAFRQAFAK